ncbi:hypothetical protein PV773_24245 [Mesorhizobium sp. CC13]|uniref:hypothetical protein n=1 Tax=Mesorhizobium sp. CC13 TaxID=3029194 RepID=UPI003263B0FB
MSDLHDDLRQGIAGTGRTPCFDAAAALAATGGRKVLSLSALVTTKTLENAMAAAARMPRKCLGFKTPSEVFRQKMMTAPRRSG